MIKELKKMQPPDYKMYGFFVQFYTVKECSVHYQNISIQTVAPPPPPRTLHSGRFFAVSIFRQLFITL